MHLCAKTDMLLCRRPGKQMRNDRANLAASSPLLACFLFQSYFINALISTSTQPSTGNFDTQGKAHLRSQETLPQVVLYKLSFLPQCRFELNKIQKILKPWETTAVYTDSTTEQLLQNRYFVPSLEKLECS